MTVPVEYDTRRSAPQRQRMTAGHAASYELFERDTCVGDPPRPLLILAAQQRRDILSHRGEAARFEKNDLQVVESGFSRIDKRTQNPRITRRDVARLFQQSLRDEWPAAADIRGETDRQPHRFHYIARGDANLRVEVVRKGVVE